MKIVTCVFKIRPGDPSYNADKILELCEEQEGDIYLFPAFVLTGVSCGALPQMKGFRARLDTAIDKLCSYTEKKKKMIVTSAQEYGNIIIVDGDVNKTGKAVFGGKQVTVSGNGSGSGDILLIPTAMPGYPCIKNDIIEFCAAASQKGKNTVAVANCGFGESSADDVFKGFCGVFRNGVITSFMAMDAPETITAVADDTKSDGIIYSRPKAVADKIPYYGKNTPDRYLNELFLMQVQALYTRLDSTGIRKVGVNVSGGLDSTLTLLVAVETMKMLGAPLTDIIALSLPCFGTTERTHSNAAVLCRELGVTYLEKDIKEAVSAHLAFIGNGEDKNTVYENAQARERAQILLDVCNMENALALGTGDLSEAALGFCTFGGDTLCHYNVNASVPKTLVRESVLFYAKHASDLVKSVLTDIAETPISPELLEGQKTEDIVGPYALHDFTMYYFAKHKMTREEIRNYELATFEEYTDDEIDHWMEVFFKRFSGSSFKRAAACEGANLIGFRLPYFPADTKFLF